MAVTHYWNGPTDVANNNFHCDIHCHHQQTDKMLPNLNVYSGSGHRNLDNLMKEKKSNDRGKNRKSVYRHVPHSQKPAHLVAKRNARERRRVQAVNSAFSRLRKHVPYEPRHKRLSKVKTLQFAIDYIHNLQDLISDHDEKVRLLQATINHRPMNYQNDIFSGSHQQAAWITQITSDQRFASIPCNGGNLMHPSTDVPLMNQGMDYMNFDNYSRTANH